MSLKISVMVPMFFQIKGHFDMTALRFLKYRPLITSFFRQIYQSSTVHKSLVKNTVIFTAFYGYFSSIVKF